MDLLEKLLDLDVPTYMTLSPDGKFVLYSTRYPAGNFKGEHRTQTLWLAETGKQKSAKQITSGLYHDCDPIWHPSGESIVFTSDRAGRGEKCALYSLGVTTGGEAIPLTPSDNESDIEEFAFSPNGKFIAYISTDEETDEAKAKKEAKDDALVWGQDLKPARLRLLNIETKQIEVLVNTQAHVGSFCWNDDGSKIAFASTRSTSEGSYSALWGITMSIVDISSKQVDTLFKFPCGVSDLIWSDHCLYFVAGISPTRDLTSECVYKVDLDSANPIPERIAHGVSDCAEGLEKRGKDIIVRSVRGVYDEISLLGSKASLSSNKIIHAWDVHYTEDGSQPVVAFVQSEIAKLPEVYTFTDPSKIVQVSDHGRAFASHNFGSSQFLQCPSADGKVELDGIFFRPPAPETVTPVPSFPTIVFIHGGPYDRDNDGYNPCSGMWSSVLLEAGFGILLINYRGSSGKGEDFAAAVRGKCGTLDYDDVITMTQAAIDRGLADKERLVVAGWSQGGCLSLLAAVRNGLHPGGWRFKAAISGGGMSDNDTMCYTSDFGAVVEDIEKFPWKTSKSDISGRRGSAIWEFHDALQNGVFIPPVLLLHGQDDERVPLEQSEGFRRALENANLPFEMAVYPREGHGICERKHLLDMAGRVLRFTQKHTG